MKLQVGAIFTYYAMLAGVFGYQQIALACVMLFSGLIIGIDVACSISTYRRHVSVCCDCPHAARHPSQVGEAELARGTPTMAPRDDVAHYRTGVAHDAVHAAPDPLQLQPRPLMFCLETMGFRAKILPTRWINGPCQHRAARSRPKVSPKLPIWQMGSIRRQ